MRSVEVRTAGARDVPRLARLGTEVFVATYGDTAAPEDIGPHVEQHFSEAAIARELSRRSIEYLLAESGDGCCGFLKLVEGAVPELVPADSALEVRQIYVATEHQRGGIGRMLMDAAVVRARARGAGGLWLSVWTAADWATRFYEGYGFHPQGVVQFRVGGTTYDDFLMWLPLDEF